MTKQELLDTIALLDRLRDLNALWVEDPAADPVTQMSLLLMRRHLTGQTTTPTALAEAADCPYTTATRRVQDMQAAGLLEYRPRTKTGRSFSVHPSPKLISKMTSLLVSVQAAIDASNAGQRRRDAGEAPADLIAAPGIARRDLGFDTGLSILVLDDPVYSISKPLARELSYLMGGHVRFHETPIDALRHEILRNAEREVSQFDIIAVDLPMIAELADRKVLVPLDDVAANGNLNSADFISAAWRGSIVDDVQYAIPILINPQILFYRRDLFAELGADPPKTTDQVLAAAKALHAPSDGRYGISWTAARGAPVGQAFVQFLADFGQPVIKLERSVGGFKTSSQAQKKITPLIDTDRGRATAEFMLRLLDVSAPGALDMGWEGQVELLRQGQVAMAYEWATRAAQLSGFPSVGDLGFLPHPTGPIAGETTTRTNVAPIGGFAFAIPTNLPQERVQIAWNAIEWMASPEVIKLLAQHGGYVTPRHSIAADPDVRQLSPMIAAVDRMARQGEIRLWPRPPVTQYTQLISILGEEIHDVLLGRTAPDVALRRAQERAEGL